MLKKTTGEKTFDTINITMLVLFMFLTVYPFIYILIASMSEPGELAASGASLFWPKKLNFGAYRMVFLNENIRIGYMNTLIYVIVGTIINIFLTSLGAYGLSRRWLLGRNTIMLLITVTMFFNGGLIPNYLVVKATGIYNTRWALMIPNAILTFNLIIMRTYFWNIPESMEESAKIDGANDFTVLFRIMLPLAIPVVAVMVLFYAVGHWNSYFIALIYLKDRALFPLQLFLREILIQSDVSDMADMAVEPIAENIKYAVIIVSTVPIMCVYPFLQKYFAGGVMVGSIKG